MGTGSTLINVVGWTVVHQIWQAAVVCIAHVIGHSLLSRRTPQARHIFSLTCFVTLVGATALTAIYAAGAETSDAALVVSESTSRVDPLMPGSGLSTDYRGGVRYQPATAVGPLDRAAASVAPWLPWIATVWLVGVTGVAFQHVVSMIVIRRVIRVADPVDGPLLDALTSIVEKMRLGRGVIFLETQRLLSPITVGLLRPLVLLPVSILSTYSLAEVEAIVAHELAHIRRFDLVVSNVQLFFETAFFFHPGVLWISRRLRRDRELCCDNDAGHYCRDFKLYADTLVKVAESFAAAPAHVLAMTSGGSLLERVVTLRRFQHTRRVSGRAHLITFVVSTGLAATAAFSVYDQASELRERRVLATLPIDRFFDLVFSPGLPSPAFEAAYIAAIQAGENSDSEAVLLGRLVDAANSGPDLNLVWHAYLPLITPTSYPTVRREFPADWRYGDAVQHRRLVARLWRHALDEYQPRRRHRIVYAAVAIGCMRREQGANTALRAVLTSPAFANASDFDERTLRLLRQYWVDVNEQTGDAFMAAVELCQSPGQHDTTLLTRVLKHADKAPEAAYAAIHVVNARTADAKMALNDLYAGEVTRRASIAAATQAPASPPVIIARFSSRSASP